MTPVAAVTWFAGHEIRLAWRELLGMLTAGARWRKPSVAIVLLLLLAFLHLPAWAVVGRFADIEEDEAPIFLLRDDYERYWGARK